VPGIRNIIAVGAGKGGVGKSTTAVNLAVALQRKGARVGLMDADVYGPNTPQMLGIEGGAVANEKTRKIEPAEAFGIKVISMGMLVPPDQPIIWRGPMLHGAVQQFMRDVEWGELDYLVVDLPPGTGDVSLSMAQSVPVAGAVVVTTPQGVSVSDVRKAVGMFRQLNIPILGVVENMSYFVCGHCQEKTEIFGHGGGARMAEDLSIPLLGQIPIDTRVRAGGDEGRPIVSAAPEAPAAKAFLEIAGRVAAEISKQNARVLKVIQTA
jgi:ATP-binding protein involved in chromosome partitioning